MRGKFNRSGNDNNKKRDMKKIGMLNPPKKVDSLNVTFTQSGPLAATLLT
jgi:hypothetical protein